MLFSTLLFLITALGCESLLVAPASSQRTLSAASSSSSSLYSVSDVEEDSFTSTSSSTILERIEDAKVDLVKFINTSSEKPPLDAVRNFVDTLEGLSEQGGIGQASSHSGLLSGEWELLYSPEDITRSSPFFWAFRRAFPDQSDQIFSITDSIPAPLKEVGPAIQTIDMNAKTFVSRVKVATLNGLATSIMTTRANIVGVEGLEGVRLQIDTTKPEDSTVLEKLGPLGSIINDNTPPFPSGETLEKVQPGSSFVVMQTTFCDESLRVSRNNDRINDVYVWKRKSMGNGMML